MKVTNASNICAGQPLSTGLRMVAFRPTPTLQGITILVCSFNGILCPLTIFVNVMVFIAVLRKAELRSVPNTSILCLAFADLLVGALVQPSYIAYQASKLKLQDAGFPCSELLAYSFLGVICICFSFLTLTLITLERYLAVFCPFKYTTVATKRRIVVSNMACWLTWIGLVVTLRLSYGINSSQETAAISVVIATNFVLTFFVYWKIFRFVQKCVSHVGPQNGQPAGDLQEAKASRTVALITGTLFLCFAPTLCATAVDQAGLLEPEALYHLWYPLAETAVLFNSFLNPIIYVWRTEGIRQSVQEISDDARRLLGTTSSGDTWIPLAEWNRFRAELRAITFKISPCSLTSP